MEQDPKEMLNVYDDPAYKQVRETMHQKLDETRKAYNDSDENDNRFLDAYNKALK